MTDPDHSNSRATVWASVIGGVCLIIATLLGGAKVGRHDAETTIDTLREDLQKRDQSLDQMKGLLERREAQVQDLTVKIENQQEAIQELSRELQSLDTRSRNIEHLPLPREKDQATSPSDHVGSDTSFVARSFRLEVVDLDIKNYEVVLVVDLEPIGDEPVQFEFAAGKVNIIDKNGGRWPFAHLQSPDVSKGVRLIPETTLRSQLLFTRAHPFFEFRNPDPELPEPPFTFAATEKTSSERIVINGLTEEMFDNPGA